MRYASIRSIRSPIFLFWFALTSSIITTRADEPAPIREQDVQIVAGEDRTVYEFRQNGILTAIKVVPKKGRPYYMVPVDDGQTAPMLEHAKRLYPQWILLEW
jgi:hypothetical protein